VIHEARQNQSARFTATLVDVLTEPDGTAIPIPGSTFTKLTLRLYDHLTGDVINGWDDVDLLPSIGTGALGVTLDEAGHLTWDLVPADNAILEERCAYELHHALFVFEWNAAGKPRGDSHQMDIRVLNVRTQ